MKKAMAIGAGLANTITIITNQGATATDYAARVSCAHNRGGYTDWYLPSKGELDKLWDNRAAIGIGGFTAGLYWSSSEGASNTSALEKQFQEPSGSNGQSRESVKLIPYGVRAVRTF